MENETKSDNFHAYMNACAKYGDLTMALKELEEQRLKTFNEAKELFEKIKGSEHGEKK